MYNFQRVLKILFWLSVAFAVYLLSPMGEHMIEGFDFLKDYQKERFLSAFNPFADPYGNSYQLINGLISFSTGGWLGTGFGSSVRKYTNFPAANTDYILAIVVEELGYAGFCFLMLLYCTIIFQLFRHATRIKSEKARIIMIGTAMYLMVHMFFNIGGVTGLVPLTGIPLLMISAGGSSTMSFMMAVGISQAVISAYRRGEIQ
jgi:cell division protein FtsW